MNDFNPGVLGIILWGIISYLFRKKKDNNLSIVDNVDSYDASKAEYLGDYIEDNLDIALDNNTEDINNPYIFMDSNIDNQLDSMLEYKADDLDNNFLLGKNDFDLSEEISDNSKFKNNFDYKEGFSRIFRNKRKLEFAFIVKEILDKPLSLRNYD